MPERTQNNSLSDSDRIRKPGGGRKSSIESIPGIDALFLKELKDFTAGNPMNEEVKLTHLTYAEIAETMSIEGIDITNPLSINCFSIMVTSSAKHSRMLSWEQ